MKVGMIRQLGGFLAVCSFMLIAPLSGNEGAVWAREYTVAFDARGATSANAPVTFGMVFDAGDVPFGAPLNATFSIDGQVNDVQLQVDRKSSYCSDAGFEFKQNSDCPMSMRSLRHAVVTALMPVPLAASQRALLTLSTNTGSPESVGIADVDIGDLGVTTRLVINGETWVADLSAATFEETSNSFGTRSSVGGQWLDGPIVVERIFRSPIRNVNGVEHDNLVVLYGLRYHPVDGSTRIEIIVENTKINGPSVRSYNYDVSVEVDGVTRYSDNSLSHFPHARWRIDFWRTSRPALHVMHDPAQLLATGAFPNYDPSLINSLASNATESYKSVWAANSPSEFNGVLNFPGRTTKCYEDASVRKQRLCTDPGVFALSVNTIGPMGVGALPAWYMPTTGSRSDIGPLPTWAATWLLSQDYSTLGLMKAVADGSGSWPIHLRDEVTGLPVAVTDHPNTKFGPTRTNAPVTIATCTHAPDCQLPYTPDGAHQGSFAYVPYLITGEHYYLEEVQFWATWNAMSLEPSWRGAERALLERSNQVRGAAWTLRNLAHAAWATPDEHALKGVYLTQLENNIEEYAAIYLDSPDQSNRYGALVGGTYPVTSPWMDDYFTWVIGHVAQLGFESAERIAKWKGKFPVQRLGYGGAGDDDYCWVFAAQYHLLLAPSEVVPASMDPSIATVTHTRGISTVASNPLVMFRDITSVFKYSNIATNGGSEIPYGGGVETSEACGTTAQFAEQGIKSGQLAGNSASPTATVAQMGPAVAVAVDSGTDGARDAWQRFVGRKEAPDYRSNPTWAVIPRSVSNLPGQLSGGGECRIL